MSVSCARKSALGLISARRVVLLFAVLCERGGCDGLKGQVAEAATSTLTLRGKGVGRASEAS